MDWLLRRLADRLGVEPARAGEAIVPRLRFEQPWPQAVTLLVVAACAALIVWVYRREGSAPTPYKMTLAALRIALVLLVVLMLSEVVLSVERTGLPYFVVMVDDSASEQVVDQYADPKVRAAVAELARGAGHAEASRIAVAQGWLLRDDAAVLRELQKQHKVKVYLVSTAARPLAEVDRVEDLPKALESLRQVEATGGESRLGDGLRQILTELRGAPPTAVLALTDGQTTDGESLARAAELAARKGVPIYAIGLGDPEPPRDLELSDLVVDDVVFVDDIVRFQARLSGRGFAGQEVEVRLRERDPSAEDDAGATDLETIRVPVPPDGQPRKVELTHRPKQVGDHTYIIEVVPQPRELQAENNRLMRTVSVRKEKLKVLYADGQPRYEYRYLKNYLERDETIDLNVVLQSSDPEYADQDRSALPTFPAARDALFAYDVVLLGDVAPDLLSQAQMDHLAAFVTEKGGGLLFIAGENFDPVAYEGTPLDDLLPIVAAEARNPTALGTSLNAFRPALTAEGRANPIFRLGPDEASSLQIWESLPELFWYMEAPRKKPAAFVLAEHPEAVGPEGKLPLMLYQFVGAGKTMFHAVDETWRWRFRAGDKFFGRFWVQTIRFLARSKLLGKQAEVTADRARYRRNQPISLKVRFPNPGLAPGNGEVTVQVERRGHGPRRVTLRSTPAARNVFEGALAGLPEGEYTVRLLPPPVLEGSIPATTFRVEPPAGERDRIQMNRPELVRAAAASGGKFYTPTTAAGLLKDLPKPQKVPLDTDPPIPLWNTWPLLALFLLILTVEWVLRKRKQMV